MFGKNKVAEAVDTVKIDTDVLLRASGRQNDFSHKELVGAIDQGTSSSRFLLFTKEGKVAAWAQKETTQIFPSQSESMVGWHEHDPFEIWQTVKECMAAVVDIMDREVKKHTDKHFSGYTIASIGITNQRETTIAWNATTGATYYNAIVWDDTRTVSIASQIAQGDDDRLREKTGLPLASYFAGTKVRWLLDNVTALQEDLANQPEVVRFGTVDTWILYQLTGTPAKTKGITAANVGGHFVTDVSNASRWLLMDLFKVQWDESLVKEVCGPHNVPLSAFPEVRPSSEVYATLEKESTGLAKMKDVPVAAILGDQQAALFGQVAFKPGEAKNTYGTGMFLMMNTGTQLVPSAHGLLTTIAYQINDEVVYALEGSVSHSGSTIQWLRDQIGLLDSAVESEALASKHNDGLYMVPAFAGLFAPHWRPDARGCIVGITAAHDKGHIIRAALEASCYQAREVFEAIEADSNVMLTALKVDGGGSHNDLMMQFQADMINAPVVIPKVQETTAMGAAFAAGLAVGTWKDTEEIKTLWNQRSIFVPKMPVETREKNWQGWKKAITRSLDWVEDEEEDEEFVDARESDLSASRSWMILGSADNTSSTSENPSNGRVAFGKYFPYAIAAALGGSAGFFLGRQRR